MILEAFASALAADGGELQVGRTDLGGGSMEVLLHSIRTVLFPFGDDARVYPGHGPDTTIGRERKTNPYLQER